MLHRNAGSERAQIQQLSPGHATVARMTMNSRQLRGIELRYVLTMNLALHGRATIPDMIEMLEHQGFAVPGCAPKVVSDALRWEVRRDRVRRLRRGLYGPVEMPRSTEHYIHKRVLALRDEAAAMSGSDDAFWDALD